MDETTSKYTDQDARAELKEILSNGPRQLSSKSVRNYVSYLMTLLQDMSNVEAKDFVATIQRRDRRVEEHFQNQAFTQRVKRQKLSYRVFHLQSSPGGDQDADRVKALREREERVAKREAELQHEANEVREARRFMQISGSVQSLQELREREIRAEVREAEHEQTAERLREQEESFGNQMRKREESFADQMRKWNNAVARREAELSRDEGRLREWEGKLRRQEKDLLSQRTQEGKDSRSTEEVTSLQEMTMRQDMLSYLVAPNEQDERCMLYTLNAVALCAGRPRAELWQHAELLGIARARKKALAGHGKGAPLYGNKHQGCADFLQYMVRFTGWTTDVPGPDGSPQYFGKFTKPSSGFLHIVHEKYTDNSGHFFVLDLRQCERIVKDGQVRRFYPANILDSRNFPFSFHTWYSTSDRPDCTYVRLARSVCEMRKVDAMENLMKVADISIIGKRRELSFFDADDGREKQ